MEALGIDIGFGFTKATNGQDAMVFKSIYGDTSEIQFWADFGATSPSDYIHVVVDGKSYFVGDLAAHLQPLLAGHVLPIDSSSDPRLNNVKGYVKTAKFVWGNSAVSKPSSAPSAEFEPHPPFQEVPEEAATPAH